MILISARFNYLCYIQVTGYVGRIRVKDTAKCGVQIAEMLLRARSNLPVYINTIYRERKVPPKERREDEKDAEFKDETQYGVDHVGGCDHVSSTGISGRFHS